VIVRTDKDRNDFIVKLLRVDLSKGPAEVSYKRFKPSAMDEQKAIANIWYAEIARQTGQTPDEVARFCKWTYGCPIFAEKSVEFNDLYTAMNDKYTYEENLRAMAFVQVTSDKRFGKKMMTEYLNHIELYAAELGCTLSRGDS